MLSKKQLFLSLTALVFTVTGLTACNDIRGPLGEWQAVFLSSGQVYYGKLNEPQGQFYRLSDVYYIRRNPAPPEGQAPQGPQLTLIKMGSELHGPEDEMIINRDHILYIENLKAESEVAKKIAEAKAQVAAAAKNGDAAPEQPAAAATLPGNQLSPEEIKQFEEFKKFQAAQQAKNGTDAAADKK